MGCGLCSGCLAPRYCEQCDHCRDKKKFGGDNNLKKACRMRRCVGVPGVEEEVEVPPEVAEGEEVVEEEAEETEEVATAPEEDQFWSTIEIVMVLGPVSLG